MPVLSSSTVRVFGHSSTNHEHPPLPVIADSGLFRAFIARLTGYPPPSRPILASRSSRAPAGVYAIRPFRRLHCLDGRSKNLYALYASKNRLCMLCENTTPKKTAYNAYRNANRRVRRAERLKMYALKDAYRLHTKCIQAYKKRKREDSSFYFFFYIVCFYLLLPVLTGNQTPPPALSGMYDPTGFASPTTKKRPTSKGGAFRVTGRNQAVWRPRVGWRRPKPASVMPMQASAMTASMAPPTSRPVRARLGR